MTALESILFDTLRSRLGPRWASLLLDLLSGEESNWELARVLEIKAFQVQHLRNLFPLLYQKAHPLRLVKPVLLEKVA